MKLKRLIYLFLGLILGAFLLVFMDIKRPGKFFPEEEERLLAGLAPEDVAGVEIIRAGEKIRMTREGREWKIETAWDHPASVSAVENLLRRLESITVGHPVTANRREHSRFEVDERGWRVLLFDSAGEPRFDLVVGKRGADMLSNFVRRSDSDIVYLWRESLSWVVNTAPGRWIKRDIFGVSPDDCREFSVGSGDGDYRWVRDESDSWRQVDPDSGNASGRPPAELLSLLLSTRPLELAGLTGDYEDRFNEPVLVFEIITREGGEIKAVVGDREGNRYLFRLEDSPYVYRVGSSPLDEVPGRLAP